MNKEFVQAKNQASTYVEIKRVTWTKDSHGLFDYESKSVNFSKSKVEGSCKVYKEESDIKIKPTKGAEPQMEVEEPNYLFSILNEGSQKDRYALKTLPIHNYESNKQNLFLIVRSLKNEEGVQRGYTLELGDIIRLGRIEYRVIEYQDANRNRLSLFDLGDDMQSGPFKLDVKKCDIDPNVKNQCRICLMDEHDTPEILINPCSCKGTGAYVHVECVQKWINSKVKQKANQDSACSYWKHLICEVCKSTLPDLVEVNGSRIQLVPTVRPDTPYMLVERIFYDKSKGGDNSRMMVLLSLSNESSQLKLGRGHDCDIRENDISVSRLHAYIKYENHKFVIVDNNSKFGTLILLRRELEIEKKKIAVQVGRTVITFSLKQGTNNLIAQPEDPQKLNNNNNIQQWLPKNFGEVDKETEDLNLNGGF